MYQNAVHAVAHRTLQRTPGARARARCVCARAVYVCVGLSLATLTRYADGSRQIQKRGTVFSVCIQTRNGASNGSGSGLTGCLSRAHRACAPKPTRMAVGLTRDCREALRLEVQGSSESSTRRSANSKRHVGAPNRHTKQVKRLVDHRCSGVTVRKAARYQKPSRTPHTRVTGSRPTCLSVALQLSGAPARRVTGWAASGCGCTETCPVTRDLRASRRLHVPAGRSGRLRGARSLEVSFHRPLVRRAGWRLVPACGNKEVDAYRSIDELARSGGYWVEALHRSHIESGDFMGASRPRARSVPRTSVWGRPLGTGVQVGGRGVSYGSQNRHSPPGAARGSRPGRFWRTIGIHPGRLTTRLWCPCMRSAAGR